MKAVQQIFFTVLVLVIIPMVGLSVVITSWLADRAVPLTINRMWATPDKVKACGEFQLWVDRYAERETGLDLEYFLTDSAGQSAPPIVYSTKSLRGPLGQYAYSVNMKVPCSFKPGWAVMERRVDYWRNIIHQYIWPIPGRNRKIPICIIADGAEPEAACKKPYPPLLDW